MKKGDQRLLIDLSPWVLDILSFPNGRLDGQKPSTDSELLLWSHVRVNGQVVSVLQHKTLPKSKIVRL